MMTLSALESMKAASSELPLRWFFWVPSPAAAVPLSAPKPPRITDRNGRFMALHMM